MLWNGGGCKDGLSLSIDGARTLVPTTSVGDYQSIDVGKEDIFAYLRLSHKGNDFLIVLNLGDNPHTLDLSSVANKARIEISTSMEATGEIDLQVLVTAPNEGLVLRL